VTMKTWAVVVVCKTNYIRDVCHRES
jgi:hypothetical protein